MASLLKLKLEIFIAGLTLALFLWITDQVVTHRTSTFDNLITQHIYSYRGIGLTSFMKIVTLFGKEVIFTFSALITLWFIHTRKWKELKLYVALVGGGEMANIILKLLVSRSRPTLEVLVSEPGKSFPSGHSMDSVIFYLLLTYGVWYFTKNRIIAWVLGIIVVIIILMVGFSRVYLGAHYPTDVIGGYLAGLLWIQIFYIIYHGKSVGSKPNKLRPSRS